MRKKKYILLPLILIITILVSIAVILFIYNQTNSSVNTNGWKVYDSSKFDNEKQTSFTFMYPPEFGSGDPTVVPEFNRTLRNPNLDISKSKAVLDEKYVEISMYGLQPKADIEKMVNIMKLNKVEISDLDINGKKVVIIRSVNPQYITENLYFTTVITYTYLTPDRALYLTFTFRNQQYDEKLIKDILSTVSLK